MFLRYRFPIVVLWTIVATLVLSNNAMAYIGPGSGMEFFGYAMGLIAMVGVALLTVLMWPIYTVLRWLRGTKSPQPAEQSPATTLVADAPPASPSAPTDNGQTPPPPPSVP